MKNIIVQKTPKKHLEEKGILQPEKNPLTFASLINYANCFDKIGEIGKINTIDRILKNL